MISAAAVIVGVLSFVCGTAFGAWLSNNDDKEAFWKRLDR
jgi:hypothetical protein